jgi:hypothetical protein
MRTHCGDRMNLSQLRAKRIPPLLALCRSFVAVVIHHRRLINCPSHYQKFGQHGGMHAVLEREQDFSIVGVAADGLEAVRLTERFKPDILVLDLMMPGLSGLEALRILRERSPRTRVVILSMHGR